MTSARLSGTVNVVGASSELCTPDVYGISNKNSITNIKSVLDGYLSPTLDWIKDKNSVIQSIIKDSIKAIDVVKGALTLNPAKLMAALTLLSPNLPAALRDIDSGIKDAITTVNEINKIKYTINGVQQIIKKADLKSLNGIADAINLLSGKVLPYEFKDVAATIALCSGLVREASKLGMKNTLKSFLESDLSKEIKVAIVIDAIDNLLKFNDKTIIDDIMGSRLYIPEINAFRPNFIYDYTGAYKEDTGRSNIDFAKAFEKTISFFNALDNNWYTKVFNGYTLLNGTVIRYATPDFKRSLEAYVDSKGIHIDPNNSLPDTSFRDNWERVLSAMRLAESESEVRMSLMSKLPFIKL